MIKKSIKHKWLSIWTHPGIILLDFNDVKLFFNKYFSFCFQDTVEKLCFYINKHAEKNWLQLNYI